jgi:hypothetical protein
LSQYHEGWCPQRLSERQIAHAGRGDEEAMQAAEEYRKIFDESDFLGNSK